MQTALFVTQCDMHDMCLTDFSLLLGLLPDGSMLAVPGSVKSDIPGLTTN